MDMRLPTGRKAKLAAALVVATVVAGGALAYWTNGGFGSAANSAGATQEVVISAGTPTTHLFPGESGDVALSISNPNEITVHLPSLLLDPDEGTNGFGVDAGHSGCDLSSLGYTTQTNGGLGWDVPTSGLVVELEDAVSLATTAPNSCQGASFEVYIEVGS